MGEYGKFFKDGSWADLIYAAENDIYHLDYLDDKGRDFLHDLGFDDQIALHKSNGEIVKMKVIGLGPQWQAIAL